MPDEKPADLPLVRKLAAIGFRSWPAANTSFDGTWAMRLTAGFPSKRQNCIVPLDPGDTARLDDRIARAETRFRAFGRPPTFQLSPLAPPALDQRLEAEGWARIGDSAVLLGRLDAMNLSGGLNMVPLQDLGRWLDAQVVMGAFPAEHRPGIAETLNAIRSRAQGAHPIGTPESPVNLYVTEDKNGEPLAALAAVLFGSLVGLFQIVTAPDRRREGHAQRLIASVLTSAARAGATQAWLQVERENEPALSLYQRLGLAECYGYHYWQKP